MSKVLPYLKALVAAVVAGVAVLVTASDSATLTLHDWLVALLAFLVALGAVFVTPNKT